MCAVGQLRCICHSTPSCVPWCPAGDGIACGCVCRLLVSHQLVGRKHTRGQRGVCASALPLLPPAAEQEDARLQRRLAHAHRAGACAVCGAHLPDSGRGAPAPHWYPTLAGSALCISSQRGCFLLACARPTFLACLRGCTREVLTPAPAWRAAPSPAQPTNHLDLEACVWLEDTLKNWKRILLLVSHSQVWHAAPAGGRPSLEGARVPLLCLCTVAVCARGAWEAAGLVARPCACLLCCATAAADARPSFVPCAAQDFLNGVCTNIIHMHQKQLKYYAGGAGWWDGRAVMRQTGLGRQCPSCAAV